jgi:ribA/ribD-fused uncharacterized protein
MQQSYNMDPAQLAQMFQIQSQNQPQVPVQQTVAVQQVQAQQGPVSLTGGARAPTPMFFSTEKDPATGFLSNDFYSPFFGTNGGERYLSAQHYIAQKKARVMKDAETEDKIMSILLTDEQAKNPAIVDETMKKIKDLGNQVKNFDKAVWDQVKIGVVSQALFYKFSQNEPLLMKFMLTQGDLLFFADENTEWGLGSTEANARQVAGAQWGVTIFTVEQIATFYDQYSQNLLGKILMDVRQKFRQGGIPTWAVTLSEDAKAAIARRIERAAQAAQNNSIQNNNNVEKKEEVKADLPRNTTSIDDSAEYPPLVHEVDETPADNHSSSSHDSSHSEEDVLVNPLDLKAISTTPPPVVEESK